MAAGTYSGQAGLYDSTTNELQYLLQGQKGGLTQVCPHTHPHPPNALKLKVQICTPCKSWDYS